MPKALALSPHLDDAAFSVGGTLATLAAAGWDVTMATIFTASVPEPKGFALACQTDKGLDADVDYMALRREEDRRAADALGIRLPVHLPFREAPHRGYGSAPELFGGTLDDDDIVGPLAEAVSGLVLRHDPDLVLAPQAVGGHADHIQLVRAIREAGHVAPILWWRDFPYTVRSVDPKEPLRAQFMDLPEGALCYSAFAGERKGRACAAYTTQLGFQFGGVGGLKRRLAEERSTERFRMEGSPPAAFVTLLADRAVGA